MWSAVGNLASIVTIVGFVITIWQLFALKKSVKKSEQAIREVLDDKEYEKLKHILEVTENQLKEVSSLLIKVDKQGVNQKSIRERCVNVCSELNKCYISYQVEIAIVILRISFWKQEIIWNLLLN